MHQHGQSQTAEEQSPAYEPPCAQELDAEHGPADAAAMVIITQLET